ncbi:MAG: Crp/Fnr family transcriptional regulator [Eubacteriaceae bacterium]|nr:Crp/Fnr family transcriptional regulator [Eubacteriaceae bacterium]
MEKQAFIHQYAHFLPFWDHLTQNQQNRLAGQSSEVHYEKGQNVHGNAGGCTGVILVKSGSLRAYMLSDKGKEITLYRLSAGDVCMLSASCVLQAITFDVFVDAESPSELLVIRPGVFSELTSENLEVENFALAITTKRFSDVMWAMQQILFMSFDKRLALFLLKETTRSSPTLTMTMGEIARYLGSAREVVSRMIKYFVSESLVSHNRKTITILDRERLKAITES